MHVVHIFATSPFDIGVHAGTKRHQMVAYMLLDWTEYFVPKFYNFLIRMCHASILYTSVKHLCNFNIIDDFGRWKFSSCIRE